MQRYSRKEEWEGGGGGRYQNSVFYTSIPVDGDRFRIVFDGALFASHSWIRSTAVTSSTRHPSTRCSWPWPFSSSPNWTAANLSGFNSFYSSSWYLGSWTFLAHLICLSGWWTCLVNVHCTSKLFFDFHQFLYNFLTNFIINNFLWRFFIYPSLDFLSQSTEKWTYLFLSLIFCLGKFRCKTFHQISIISTPKVVDYKKKCERFEDFEIFYFFDQKTCSVCCPLLPFKVGCESFRYIGNLIWQIGEKEIFLIDLHLFWFTMKIFIFDFLIFHFYICKSWNCCPLLHYKGCMKQLRIIRKLVWHMNEKEYTYIHFQLTGIDLGSHFDGFQMSYFLS